MYLIEWITPPARAPIVVRSAKVEVGSVEVALAQAEAELHQIIQAEPQIAGYRICRHGQPPLITRWIESFFHT